MVFPSSVCRGAHRWEYATDWGCLWWEPTSRLCRERSALVFRRCEPAIEKLSAINPKTASYRTDDICIRLSKLLFGCFAVAPQVDEQ